ncbi:hypothetical protein [Photobacterium aquimaris]|uniref:Chromosome partition protein Smc n=1 Tax=Photobacterium aquimaris TaxID=512643 RepID=A0A1Y6L0D6_9GAMM|nr:hypothetical protein [Photobacterium aquimaris]SMY16098.1 hypothetical protein PAQU9191_01329 [Photobacterium aquimaris]
MRKILFLFLFLFFSSNANAQLLCISGGVGSKVAGCDGTYTEAAIRSCVEKQTDDYRFDYWVPGIPRQWRYLRKRSSGDGWYAAGSDNYYCSADTKCPVGTELVNGECKETNYCDSIQYQVDYDAAKNACESKTTEFQTATFSGQCNREAERLESSCDITGVTPPEPPPETCPDGSAPPCDDGDGGGGGGGGGDGGGSGGGGTDGDGSGDIDLSGILEAINNNNKSITGAITDSRPAVNDLLNVQTKALSTSVESNRLLGVGIAALDVSNDALSNIANLTRDLNNKTASEVSQSVESNRLLGQNNAALNASNNALSNIADLTQGLNDTVTTTSDRIADEIIKNTDELKLQTAKQDQITESQLASNDLLTGINTNTDKTNELLANIDKSISSSSSITSNELSEMLGSLSQGNKDNNDDIINKLNELERNANKHDLDYGEINGIAGSARELVNENLDEYQNSVEGTIARALIDTPMTESLFAKVKEFANELIPISSTCQNLSFGDYFTIECSKFQKFRDIFGFFIYVYTALTLIDILFTGIVPNPARKPY